MHTIYFDETGRRLCLKINSQPQNQFCYRLHALISQNLYHFILVTVISIQVFTFNLPVVIYELLTCTTKSKKANSNRIN